MEIDTICLDSDMRDAPNEKQIDTVILDSKMEDIQDEMQIDTVGLDRNMEDTQDESAEQSLSPCSSETGGIFGDPVVPPCIGDEYQAEIPSLLPENDRLQLIQRPLPTEAYNHAPHVLGLPIPVTWSTTGTENINGTIEFENSEQSRIISSIKYPEFKAEPEDALSDHAKDMTIHPSFLSQVGSNEVLADLALPREFEKKRDLIDRGSSFLPELLCESWTDLERGSFLLGLYIFGKDLVAVEKFVETKKMGDILTFYYGEFYRSINYRRWSEGRKQKNKRSIHGHKIFINWRQEELLSRLSSHVSKEDLSLLPELCRRFNEGKISFEEYIFNLKNVVGINMLVQAVGIGKGKDDLTGTAMEPVKHTQTVSARPEIPVGKACSSLATADVIKFLTGDFRLSKARSNDLFWEAVWPRLLARGWHSEQPNDISGSKNSLVFLIPGVKKFSRRKLVKGNHYFDSVSDVLSKVASEPGLLEFDLESTKGSQHREEGGQELPQNQDLDDRSNKQRHCYLQPRNLDYDRNLPKFTIVDTSLAHGAERNKVRELRSLPIETASVSTFSSISSDTDEDLDEDLDENAVETNTSNPEEDVTKGTVCVDSSEFANQSLNIAAHICPDPDFSTEGIHENQNKYLNMEVAADNTMVCQFMQKETSGCSKYLVSPTKQQGKLAHDRGDSSCMIKNLSPDGELTGDEANYRSGLPDAYEVTVSQVYPSASSFAKNSPAESSEGVNTGFLCRHASPTKSPSPKLIDLNLPSVSTDLDGDEYGATATEQNVDYSCTNNSSFLSGLNQQPQADKHPDAVVHTEQQPAVNSRRQSTRSRPLTTKALEALEQGFLTLPLKRKGRDMPGSNSISRPSSRVRRKNGSKPSRSDEAELRTEESSNGLQTIHDTKTDMDNPSSV